MSYTDRMNYLTPLERNILRGFLAFVLGLNDVVAVYLYGSRAVGKSNEFSDMDVAVVTKHKDANLQIRRQIELWINENADIDVLLHVFVLDRYALRSRVIGQSIKRGRLLWQAS